MNIMYNSILFRMSAKINIAPLAKSRNQYRM